MNGKQLQKMIEVAVQKEVRESLPGLVREVLTEVFLRKVVSEQSSPAHPASRPLAETVRVGPSTRGRSREELRRMVVDDDDGLPPGYVSPFPETRGSSSPLLADSNPLKSLYEDVSLDEESGADDVDLSRLFDQNRVKMISEEVTRRAAANVSDPVASALRSRKIAESMKVG